MLLFFFLFSDSTLGNGILPIELEGQALLMVGVGRRAVDANAKRHSFNNNQKSKALRRADEMQLEGKSIYKNDILWTS